MTSFTATVLVQWEREPSGCGSRAGRGRRQSRSREIIRQCRGPAEPKEQTHCRTQLRAPTHLFGTGTGIVCASLFGPSKGPIVYAPCGQLTSRSISSAGRTGYLLLLRTRQRPVAGKVDLVRPPRRSAAQSQARPAPRPAFWMLAEKAQRAVFPTSELPSQQEPFPIDNLGTQNNLSGLAKRDTGLAW